MLLTRGNSFHRVGISNNVEIPDWGHIDEINSENMLGVYCARGSSTNGRSYHNNTRLCLSFSDCLIRHIHLCYLDRLSGSQYLSAFEAEPVDATNDEEDE